MAAARSQTQTSARDSACRPARRELVGAARRAPRNGAGSGWQELDDGLVLERDHDRGAARLPWKRPDNADTPKKDKVFNVASDKIDEITITPASGDGATAKKENGNWKLVAPDATPADESEISGVANTLSNAEIVRVVDDNPASLNDYGLSNPRVAIAFKADGGQQHKLYLGEKTPTGSDLFARRDDDKKIFLIAAYQETSLNKSAFDLRDKNILKIDRDKIDSVDLTAGSQSVTIAKDGGEWKLKKPNDVRADYGTVEGLIGKLQTARMGARCCGDIADRQLEEEGGTSARVAVVADCAAVRLDDSIAHGQTEAGALADSLGRKERLEQLRFVLGGHSGSVVLHFEAHFLAAVEHPDENATLLMAGGLDGLLRVDDEIENDLFELREICAHLPR